MGSNKMPSFVALLVALMIILAVQASAAPYFRVLDPNRTYKVTGAYIDPADAKQTEAGYATALVTHSTRDGCIFPSVVCEDWSPLMIGFSAKAGRFSLNAGPGWNLAPIFKAGLLYALNNLSREDQYAGAKSALGSEPISGPSASLAFGPALNVEPVQHGVIIPLSQWRGKPRIFAGAAFQF